MVFFGLADVTSLVDWPKLEESPGFSCGLPVAVCCKLKDQVLQLLTPVNG